MSQKSQSDGGNTNSPSSTISESKDCGKHRKYCFTLNNYTPQNIIDIKLWMTKKTGCKFVFGEEVGEQSGTPHLQGFVQFKNQVRWSTLKKLMPRAHIEAARGSMKENYDYCSKDGRIHTNLPKSVHQMVLELEYDNDKVCWMGWQKKILEITQGSSNDRKIHWYYDRYGAIGKTYLCKYLCLKYDAILVNGKRNDVFNQVANYLEINQESEKYPKLILVDIPRSCIGYVNYGTLEALKNGCLFSGKYQSTICLFPRPHVICFANTEPDISQLSGDRWIVTCLDGAEQFNTPREFREGYKPPDAPPSAPPVPREKWKDPNLFRKIQWDEHFDESYGY